MALQANYANNGVIELWDDSKGGGNIVRCYPDGRIELFVAPNEDEKCFEGYYPTVCAALAEAAKRT